MIPAHNISVYVQTVDGRHKASRRLNSWTGQHAGAIWDCYYYVHSAWESLWVLICVSIEKLVARSTVRTIYLFA